MKKYLIGNSKIRNTHQTKIFTEFLLFVFHVIIYDFLIADVRSTCFCQCFRLFGCILENQFKRRKLYEGKNWLLNTFQRLD